jgi:hypothetical protein
MSRDVDLDKSLKNSKNYFIISLFARILASLIPDPMIQFDKDLIWIRIRNTAAIQKLIISNLFFQLIEAMLLYYRTGTNCYQIPEQDDGVVLFSVSNPDPDWIPTQSGQWIHDGKNYFKK